MWRIVKYVCVAFSNKNDHTNKSSTWGFNDPWSPRTQNDHDAYIRIDSKKNEGKHWKELFYANQYCDMVIPPTLEFSKAVLCARC